MLLQPRFPHIRHGMPRRNLAALRQHSRSWLSALCSAFAATVSEERGPLAAANTAYAAVADAETAAQFFRIAVQKLVKARAVTHPDALRASLHPAIRRLTCSSERVMPSLVVTRRQHDTICTAARIATNAYS
jgi:hypothetical protein